MPVHRIHRTYDNDETSGTHLGPDNDPNGIRHHVPGQREFQGFTGAKPLCAGPFWGFTGAKPPCAGPFWGFTGAKPPCAGPFWGFTGAKPPCVV
ncbi:hypothetical protein GCM10023153_15630 [Ornithinibacter aureus]|uniref:Uncharacterized protein n=1 Tax=Ornithinibacter aureus TaxID=622664 RepID=A0ABP8JQJ6_9MICO